MKALKLSVLLPLLALTLLAFIAQMSPSVAAQTEIARNDHEALARHYENLAREAGTKLQENKEVLEACEARPYYYGSQGQDIRSRSFANIREYEKTLQESLSSADLHRRIIIEQDRNLNQAVIDLDHDLTAIESEYSGEEL